MILNLYENVIIVLVSTKRKTNKISREMESQKIKIKRFFNSLISLT